MGVMDQKVVLVTGAGGGLGRAYALLLAELGAKVVVNDRGVDRHGDGEGEPVAERVVKEIRERGGEAIANYDSVSERAGAKAMVDAAFEAFGRLDGVINNAGILRDKTLVKMDDAMWDAVMDVHLKGTYLVSQAAVTRMMKEGIKGSIVNTSSYAGLKGNFGQTNYGAAKAGIAGFTRSLALEGQRYGVRVNAIAPIAKTRMTAELSMVPEEFAADDVAPLVVWLLSDGASAVTGRVFGAHGRHYFEYVVETTPGVERTEPWSVEEVGEEFEAIVATAVGASEGEGSDEVRALLAALPQVFDGDRGKSWEAQIGFEVKGAGDYGVIVDGGQAKFIEGAPTSPDGTISFDSGETLLELVRGKLNPQQAFMAGKIGSDNLGLLMKFAQYFDLEKAGALLAGGAGGEEAAIAEESSGEGPNPKAVGKKFKPSARLITKEELIEYARAVDDENPRYLAGEVSAPLFSVRPLFEGLQAAMNDEELNADLLRLVHGDQEMRFFDVLRPGDLVTPRAEITAVEERSSGWLVDVVQRLYREGELVVEARSGLFVRRPPTEEEAKGKREVKKTKAAVEEERGALLYEEEQVVAEDQTERYARISGDHNPIHLDKEVARSAGLPDVILHGLCTMAFAARAVVDGVLDGEVERLGWIKVRFARPVLPGTTLRTRVYEGAAAGEFEFEMVDGAGKVVLSRGEAAEK